MPTDIDIASNALLLVGDEPISSFDDSGAGATVAKAIYAETYGMVLSEHPWTFAFKEQELNKLSQTPDDVTGYKNAFQLPGELIRIWALLPHSMYTIVGSLLYSNEESLLARYVFKVDETALPPHVVKALEYKLASEFAMSVTESETKADLYEKKYNLQIAKARTIDSQNKPPVPIVDSPFTDVRLNGNFLRIGF
jgi:hypothetical protein